MYRNEEVIKELLDLARQNKVSHEESNTLGLTPDELAFYGALTKPQAIKDFYKNDNLISITRELIKILKSNKTVDR